VGIAFRVRSPIASRSHWFTEVVMFNTSRPAADPVSSDSATDTSVTPRRLKRSSRVQIDASGETIQLSYDDRLYVAGVYQMQHPLKSRPFQTLRRLTFINHDIQQRRVVHIRHSANLHSLRF
jgi:hypothetical protein